MSGAFGGVKMSKRTDFDARTAEFDRRLFERQSTSAEIFFRWRADFKIFWRIVSGSFKWQGLRQNLVCHKGFALLRKERRLRVTKRIITVLISVTVVMLDSGEHANRDFHQDKAESTKPHTACDLEQYIF